MGKELYMHHKEGKGTGKKLSSYQEVTESIFLLQYILEQDWAGR